MLLPHGTVFAVVDGEKFELYRNSGKEADPDLTSMDTPELEATNYSYGSRDHDKVSRFTGGAPKDRESQLEESAHVIAVADWLNNQVLTHKIEKLVVIADPRSLGEMRKRYHKQLEGVLVGELAKDLTGRRPDDIVKALRAA
jgi:protein required for attachment to host cells